jgi:hypothetical protein
LSLNSSFDFSYTIPTVPLEKTFLIENNGELDLILPEFQSVSIIEERGSIFSMTTFPDVTIPAGSSSTFKVQFNPSEAGNFTAEMVIHSNDEYKGEYLINLTGQCIEPGQVTFPNGGEGLEIGNSYTIAWAVFNSESPVQINLMKDGNYNSTIASSTVDDGSYEWFISSGHNEGSDFRISISLVNQTDVYDLSDSDFIIGSSTGVQPSLDEYWETGSTQEISWDSEAGGQVKIELFKAEVPDHEIIDSTANDGSYDWTIPAGQTPDFDYKIHVSTLTSTPIVNESEHPFTIEKLECSSPSGSSDIFVPGNNLPVTWTSSGYGQVKLELYKNGVFNAIIVASADNDGSYTWTSIPVEQTPGNDYKVRVVSLTDNSIWAESGNDFIISTIIVTTPGAGSEYIIGSVQFFTNIYWTSSIGGNVKIELTGADYKLIEASTLNDGSYTWTPIDADLISNNNYQIKITSLTDGSVVDSSEYFSCTNWASGEGPPSVSASVVAMDTNSNFVTDDPYLFFVHDSAGQKELGRCDQFDNYNYSIQSGFSGFPVSPDYIDVVSTEDSSEDSWLFYSDSSIAEAAKLLYFNGTSLTDMGFVTTTNDHYYNLQMELHDDLDPTVAYTNGFDVGVQKYIWGSGWSAFPTPSSLGYPVTQIALDVDPADEEPIVFFRYSEAIGPINMRSFKYNPSGPQWDLLGTFRSPVDVQCAIAVGSDSLPVILYLAVENDARVEKYNGSSWDQLTSTSTFDFLNDADPITDCCIALDSNDVPWVAFIESNTGEIHVYQYDSGIDWIDWGYASHGEAASLSLSIDSNDLPIIGFSDLEDNARPKIRYIYPVP